MRIVLTIPDDVVTAEVYVKSKDDAITHSRIFEGGSITNSRFIDKEETMGMRYTEGLEKRIDALEAGLGKVYESLENNYNELDTAIDAVRDKTLANEKAIDALGNAVSDGEAIDKCIQGLNERINGVVRRFGGVNSHIDTVEGTFIERMDRLEKRLGKLEKPCIDAEAFKSLPKSTGEADATANRGVYTDILRRLCRLENRLEDVEKQAVVAEGVRKQLAADIKAIQGRINRICEETCVDA